MAEELADPHRQRRVWTVGWFRIGFFLVLLGLVALGIALWIDRDQNPTELHELLGSEPFDEAVLPAPFTFDEVHPTSTGGDPPRLVYATFSGPADRSRVTYQVLDSDEEALEVLDKARNEATAGTETEVVDTGEIVDGAFCLEPATAPLITECYAAIGEVVVRGDVWTQDGPGDEAMRWATALLEAGIDHLKSVT